jgi:DNA-binding MarR family transcriptional regulator
MAAADHGPGPERAGNLLGALALVVGDRMTEAIAEAAGRSESSAAALSALHQFLDGPTVDRLRRVLGLTSSGTVRLVDRLVDSGYAERGPGGDKRSTAVRLTDDGRAAAARVTAARGEVLDQALSVLTPEERAQFDGLLAKVLVGLMRGPGAERWMCRLCDMRACGRDQGTCPVLEENRRRYPHLVPGDGGAVDAG